MHGRCHNQVEPAVRGGLERSLLRGSPAGTPGSTTAASASVGGGKLRPYSHGSIQRVEANVLHQISAF